MRTLPLVALVCSLGFGLAGAALAVDLPDRDGECRWSAGFHVSDLDDEVNALVVFDDGTGPALYAGGAFTAAGAVVVNGVARWDGARWTALAGPAGVGVNGQVYALAVWDDGSGASLYAGGSFTTAGGVTVDHVARWDGHDWSFLAGPSGTGVNGAVYALAVFDGGAGPALVVGGAFTTAGQVLANHVARWNGTAWSPLGAGADDTVRALAAGNLGTGAALYAGGDFVTAGGVTVNRVARWEGGAWSALAGGVAASTSPSVAALGVFDLGTGPALYAGGHFVTAGGTTANNVARWTGSAWSALGAGTSADVLALTAGDLGAGAALYAGGYFWSAGGVTANGVARWDGGNWSALAGPDGNGAMGVKTLAVHDEGSGLALFAGGWLENAGGVPANRIARWNGSAWSSLSPLSGAGLAGVVMALAVHDAGSGPALYAAGWFSTAGGIGVDGVARWNGQVWSPLAGPSGSGVVGTVNASTTCDDGGGQALFAGGDFVSAGGVSVNAVARWDGNGWSPLGEGVGVFGRVFALACYDDGSGPAVVAGGDFEAAGGAAAMNVARWDGNGWSPLGEDIGGSGDRVSALQVVDEGTRRVLYAGGMFATAGGLTANSIARWDGSSWTALSGPSGTGVDGNVEALAVYDDGSGPALFVAGGFTSAGGLPATSLARWDGSAWSAVPGADELPLLSILALTVHDDGDGPALYASAFPDQGPPDGASWFPVLRWDGSAWSTAAGPAGDRLDAPVETLASFDDGAGPSLFAGGWFRSAGGIASSRIARYSCSPIFADGFESGTAIAWSEAVP